MPASNMKIVTGATSLVQLGADYTYHTDFAAGGPVVHDTLQGALIVSGRGDPSISDHMRGSAMNPLYDVADSLKAHGVTTITRGIQAAPDVFPDTTIGFGWSWDDLGEDYGAGVDALYFNEGFGTAIAYGRAGRAPDSIRTLPASSYPKIALPSHATETSADTFALRLDFDPTRTQFISARKTQNSGRHARLRLSGSARGVSRRAQRGIARAWHCRCRRGAARSVSPRIAGGTMSVTPLFTIHSPPLRAILPALHKPSQNQIAEILYKTLALEKTGVGLGGQRSRRDRAAARGMGRRARWVSHSRRQRPLALRLPEPRDARARARQGFARTPRSTCSTTRFRLRGSTDRCAIG